NALQYAGLLGDAERAALLELFAYECYLTENHEEALERRIEATGLRRRLGDRRGEGDNLRWQSRLNWFLGRNDQARQRAADAIAPLEGDACRELAMAYSNQAQLHMLAQENEEAVEWGNRAIDLALCLGDEETLAHALNNVGAAENSLGVESGFEKMTRSL